MADTHIAASIAYTRSAGAGRELTVINVGDRFTTTPHHRFLYHRMKRKEHHKRPDMLSGNNFQEKFHSFTRAFEIHAARLRSESSETSDRKAENEDEEKVSPKRKIPQLFFIILGVRCWESRARHAHTMPYQDQGGAQVAGWDGQTRETMKRNCERYYVILLKWDKHRLLIAHSPIRLDALSLSPPPGSLVLRPIVNEMRDNI